MSAKRCGLLREVNEDFLRDVLGQMGVTADAPQSDGINERDVTPDEFGEGSLRVIFDVGAEQVGVGVHGGYACRLPLNERPDKINPDSCLTPGTRRARGLGNDRWGDDLR